MERNAVEHSEVDSWKFFVTRTNYVFLGQLGLDVGDILDIVTVKGKIQYLPLAPWIDEAVSHFTRMFGQFKRNAESPLFVRFSELCKSTKWQEFDGMDPIEIVSGFEQHFHVNLPKIFWCEFPILEMAHQLYNSICCNDTNDMTEIIVRHMMWRDKIVANRISTVCEIITVLWGLPFCACTGTSILSEILVKGVLESQFYSNDSRIDGLCRVLERVFQQTGTTIHSRKYLHKKFEKAVSMHLSLGEWIEIL